MKGDIPSTADYHAAVERIRDLGEQNANLQGELAATRDKLCQVMAALGVEPFTPDEGPMLDLVDIVPIAVSRAGVLAADFEQAQARIAALEQAVTATASPICEGEENDGPLESTDLFVAGRGISLLCNVDAGSTFTFSLTVDGQHVKTGTVGLAQADARGREEER